MGTAGRPVLAWSHGATGTAENCGPSQVVDPAQDLNEYLTATACRTRSASCHLRRGRPPLVERQLPKRRVVRSIGMVGAQRCRTSGMPPHAGHSTLHYTALPLNPSRYAARRRNGVMDSIRGFQCKVLRQAKRRSRHRTGTSRLRPIMTDEPITPSDGRMTNLPDCCSGQPCQTPRQVGV